jgi:hypothetical protein|tara:strand:+ start:914 stop:1054 length:141 start_codon:yes stop_codon:yes gene_type:complete
MLEESNEEKFHNNFHNTIIDIDWKKIIITDSFLLTKLYINFTMVNI